MATKEKRLTQQLTPKEPSSSQGDRSANTQQHQPLHNNELATKFLNNPRVVTENAIKLTPDEMCAIYVDMFKPLHSFEMFYERLKAQEKEKKKEELDEE